MTKILNTYLGLNPLPRDSMLPIIGILGLSIGTYLILIANVALWGLGKGANAFFLTKRLVTNNIYERTRNPMSLGLYLVSIGLALLVGSTYMMLGALFFVIPIHVFYLKYFEEFELELRMGSTYKEYRLMVPFLIPMLVSRK